MGNPAKELRRQSPGWPLWMAQVLAVAAAYAVTGKLGLLLAIPPGYATAVWPPSGIALAGMLLFGYRVWPGVLLGSFLVNVWTGFAPSSVSSFLVPLGIGGGAALQAVVGAVLIHRFARFPNELASEREIFSFLVWGAAGCVVNAMIGVLVLLAAGKIPASNVLINSGTWWIGDAMGVVIFTPLILAWMQRPSEKWRKRRLTMTIPTAVMFVLAIVVVAYGTSWERERLRLQFDQHATILGAALEKSLNGYLGVVQSLQSFHAASRHIGRDEFRTFVSNALASYPGLQALSWNPRVRDVDRAEFEHATREEGFPEFQITEQDDQRHLVRAAERPDYVAVHYIEPFRGNERAFGYDTASSEARREAQERARDTGQPVVTARITLIQETENQSGVLIFTPVYRNGLPHETVEDRRRNLDGYMVGVLRGSDVLDAFMRGMEEEGIVHRLLDESGAIGEQLLFECHHADEIGRFLMEEKGVFGGAISLTRSLSIPFGGRQWRFEVTASQEYLARYRHETSWLILLAGLLITSTVGAFVMVVSGRGIVLQGLVDKRTAELSRLKSRMELILGAAGDGIYGLSTAGHTTFVNPAAARMVGWEPNDLIGRNQHDVLHHTRPDGSPYPREDCPIYAAFRDGKVHHVADELFWRKDGSSFPVEYTSTPMEENGEITGAVVVFRDITQRVAAEMAMQDSLNRFFSVVESLDAMVYVSDLDTDEVLFANQTVRERHGNAEGKHCWEILHPNQIGPCGACVKDQLVSAEGLPGEPVVFEYLDQTTRRWYECRDRAITWTDGRLVRMEIAFDITERKRSEDLLTRFGRIVEASSNEVYVFDAETLRFVMANRGAQQNLGYTMEELRGMTPLDLKPRITEEAFEDMIEALRSATQDHVTFETVHCRKDGSWYDVEVRLQLNRTEIPPVFIAVIQDISERKEMEQALAESNRELQSFVYIVSHDLLEPLRTMSAFVTLLQQSSQGKLDAESDELMDFIVDGVDRMTAMIRDLAEFSRVGTHGKALEPLDIAIVVRSAIANLGRAISEANAEVTVADDLPVVQGDRSQLIRLFQNLLGNALKYRAPARPCVVRIGVEARGPDWVFSVSDNGIGIAPQHFEKVFMIFQRLHGRRQYEGTGIGLAVCKRIVERHEGRIWVDSELGTGSTFRFTLPKIGKI